jgi:hypothetical protein
MKKTDLYKNAGLAVANQMKNSAPKPKGNTKNSSGNGKKLNPLLASLLKKPE